MSFCSSSDRVLSCLVYPKTTEKPQACINESKVKRLFENTLSVRLKGGGVSLLYLLPGDQETLSEAGREEQEEEEQPEEEH